ncbi:hypothetical protein OG585_37805 [Streptomyces sp. NBC_01340]|uniref:hypothetical protein n=1 Tax=unclassified Streptomyces TaxID=2593676 RepID=UPI002256A1CC|nr:MULTISPECIES: hypothetical protein [unclassified Streptomyces]MCX4458278.1 hypothetical protein [Streptomyces sp. NBC_01719]MCX4497635.1 hypothetical protein [Streptomyces sp. NBC_01728]WSI42460.1 hypothetical protein OG585_37805 [Streptomyces sp. NBC_01340]
MTSPHDPVPFEPGGQADSIDLLTAALRRDAADLEVYARVLTGTLAEALPPGSVAVERKRGMADRLAGRGARVERVEVSLGEQRLVLNLAGGHPKGEVCKEVRGVVLSRRPVPLDEWVRELAGAIAARAQSDARARAALERLVLGE